jgi:ketosteroid isomerase-like protein
MSHEHVDIVRREYAAFAARDWAALADLCHPDIEYETLKSAPGVHGCYRGLHEITEFFDSWSDLYAEFRVEVAEIVDAGDQVVTVERHAARGLKGATPNRGFRTRLLASSASRMERSGESRSSRPSNRRSKQRVRGIRADQLVAQPAS